MIEFSCSSCGRAFAVPDHFAGRRARCKSCGVELTVPHPKPAARAGAPGAPAAPAPPQKMPMRLRRLAADAEQMAKSFANSELIRVKPIAGDPPDTYQIEYLVSSL